MVTQAIPLPHVPAVPLSLLRRSANWLFYAFLLLAPYRSALWLTEFWSVQKLVGALLLAVVGVLLVTRQVRVPRELLWLAATLLGVRIFTSACATAFNGAEFRGSVISSWLQFVLIAFVAAALVETRSQLRRALLVYLVAGVISCAVYITEYQVASEFLQAQGWSEDVPIRELGMGSDAGGDDSVFTKHEQDANKAADFQLGALGNPVSYALLLLGLLPVNFFFIRDYVARKRWLAAGLLALCLGLNYFTIVLTFSRAALVIGILVSLVILVRSNRNGLRWAVIAVLLLAFALPVIYYSNVMPALSTRIEDFGAILRFDWKSDVSGNMRAAVQYAGLQLVRDHPVLGVGFGNFGIQALRYSGLEIAQTCENLYLQVMAEGGAAGFIVFVAAIAVVARRRLRRGDLDPFFTSMLRWSWLSMLLMSITIYTEFEYHTYLFAGLLFSFGLIRPTVPLGAPEPSAA